METCSGYKPKLWHFFFPTLDVFKLTCTQYDKSVLIVVSFLRLVFFMALSFYVFQKTRHDYRLIIPLVLPLLMYTLFLWVILIIAVKNSLKYSK